MIPYPVTLGIVVLGVGILDRTIIGKVDYSLLLTFVGFFIFIGNFDEIPYDIKKTSMKIKTKFAKKGKKHIEYTKRNEYTKHIT